MKTTEEIVRENISFYTQYSQKYKILNGNKKLYTEEDIIKRLKYFKGISGGGDYLIEHIITKLFKEKENILNTSNNKISILRNNIIEKCPYCGDPNTSKSPYGFCTLICKSNAINLVKRKTINKLSKKELKLRETMKILFLINKKEKKNEIYK